MYRRAPACKSHGTRNTTSCIYFLNFLLHLSAKQLLVTKSRLTFTKTYQCPLITDFVEFLPPLPSRLSLHETKKSFHVHKK